MYMGKSMGQGELGWDEMGTPSTNTHVYTPTHHIPYARLSTVLFSFFL